LNGEYFFLNSLENLYGFLPFSILALLFYRVIHACTCLRQAGGILAEVSIIEGGVL